MKKNTHHKLGKIVRVKHILQTILLEMSNYFLLFMRFLWRRILVSFLAFMVTGHVCCVVTTAYSVC